MRCCDGILVRERTDADMPRCEALLARVHSADAYPSSWPVNPAAWLTPHGLLGAWIALRGAAVIGHVALGTIDPRADPQLAGVSRHPAEQTAEIKRLFVDPSTRRGGAGTLLLAAAVRAAESMARHPILEVTADKPAALHFYERNGWRRAGTSIATWQRASGERPVLYQYEPGDS